MFLFDWYLTDSQFHSLKEWDIMLSNLDRVHISAVLEDCVDQLAILGHIMPPTLEGRPDATRVSSDCFRLYRQNYMWWDDGVNNTYGYFHKIDCWWRTWSDSTRSKRFGVQLWIGELKDYCKRNGSSIFHLCYDHYVFTVLLQFLSV